MNKYDRAAGACSELVFDKSGAETESFEKEKLYRAAVGDSPVLSNPLVRAVIFDDAEVMRLSKYKDHKSFADAVVKDFSALEKDGCLFQAAAAKLACAGKDDISAVREAEALLEKYFVLAAREYPEEALVPGGETLKYSAELAAAEIGIPFYDFSGLKRKNGEKYAQAAEYIHLNWKNLARKTPGKTRSSLIPLPHPFVVPGGRFREVYYWDSYFTILGLKESKMYALAEGMVDNFLYLVSCFGFVPNGNRVYYLSRSQPPFLAMMADETMSYDLSVPKNRARLEKTYYLVKKEYEAEWENEKTHFLKAFGLNRYFDGINEKRPEAFGSDKALKNSPDYFLHERAACESGLDFTARFAGGVINLAAVDLNALLYMYENLLCKWAGLLFLEEEAGYWKKAAEERKSAVCRYLYDPADGLFHDFDFIAGRRTRICSAANAYILWAGLASPQQARGIRDFIMNGLKVPGGILNIRKGELSGGILGEKSQEEYQWDEPNGWAPLQYIAVRGLMNYGFKKEAQEIARSWIDLNTDVFQKSGLFYEKYNIAEPENNVRTNYPQQDGFGWTNGVYLYFLNHVL